MVERNLSANSEVHKSGKDPQGLLPKICKIAIILVLKIFSLTLLLSSDRISVSRFLKKVFDLLNLLLIFASSRSTLVIER